MHAEVAEVFYHLPSSEMCREMVRQTVSTLSTQIAMEFLTFWRRCDGLLVPKPCQAACFPSLSQVPSARWRQMHSDRCRHRLDPLCETRCPTRPVHFLQQGMLCPSHGSCSPKRWHLHLSDFRLQAVSSQSHFTKVVSRLIRHARHRIRALHATGCRRSRFHVIRSWTGIRSLRADSLIL